MKVLVTGASGYIGSQTCKFLNESGHTLVGVDRNMIKHQYCKETYIGDYGDSIMDIMLQNVDCVVHIGATSLVGPSVLDPSKYYNNNVVGALKLLDACNKHGIKRFVFASSAATYGEPNGGVCLETEQHEPMNPYGWSKRMTEIMLSDYATAYGINSVSLRFFNVAGADTLMEMGQEKAATHIIAKLIEMTMDGKEFTLNGGDFNTPDGTCVRDYVHVEDVANGIYKAIEFLFFSSNSGAHIFNLGNKNGYSNLEIVEAVKRNTPLEPNVTIGPARDGDPAKLVADTTLANEKLKWAPKYNLDTIVKTAYNWYKKKDDILVENSEKK
jgi:UDP-glucose 4-epimerase